MCDITDDESDWGGMLDVVRLHLILQLQSSRSQAIALAARSA